MNIHQRTISTCRFLITGDIQYAVASGEVTYEEAGKVLLQLNGTNWNIESPANGISRELQGRIRAGSAEMHRRLEGMEGYEDYDEES